MTPLQLINLNVFNGAAITYKLEVPKTATTIVVRPRSGYENVKDIEKPVYNLALISEGYTISYVNKDGLVQYLDVMKVNSKGTHWVYMNAPITNYGIRVTDVLQ